MQRLLICYPKLFACQSKFDRKVTKITRKLTEFSVITLADPHGFIQTLLGGDSRVTGIETVSDYAHTHPTHAIIFDDGEEFTELRTWLLSRSIPTRWVKTPLTRVINLKHHPEYADHSAAEGYVYIGRGSYWGNPHAMQESGESREEVIRKYRYDFEFNKFINIDPVRVHELAGKRLGCFCKPAPCHGDVLADFLNRYDDGN